MIGCRVNRGVSGVTLIETMLAIALLSLLFAAANSVFSYSRRETEKGFWIQQGITQLRNGTRAITDMLKKTSYPTTIIKYGIEERVISFKEQREYDVTGRLRHLNLNESKAYDMHSITGGSMIRPSFKDQTIMYFPACEPEKDFDTGYVVGVINWVELVLKPSNTYSTSGLGTLYIIEREKKYDTRSDTDNRAFGLDGEFDRDLAITRSREIINDVSAIEVDSYEIDELRGIAVTLDGEKHEISDKKILISMTISVSHPKDSKIWLSDQCSVINNVRLVELAGGELIELLEVYSTGSGGSAKVKYNTSELSVSIGSKVGMYRVTSINTDSIGLKEPDSDVERLLVKRDD